MKTICTIASVHWSLRDMAVKEWEGTRRMGDLLRIGKIESARE